MQVGGPAPSARPALLRQGDQPAISCLCWHIHLFHARTLSIRPASYWPDAGDTSDKTGSLAGINSGNSGETPVITEWAKCSRSSSAETNFAPGNWERPQEDPLCDRFTQAGEEGEGHSGEGNGMCTGMKAREDLAGPKRAKTSCCVLRPAGRGQEGSWLLERGMGPPGRHPSPEGVGTHRAPAPLPLGAHSLSLQPAPPASSQPG